MPQLAVSKDFFTAYAGLPRKAQRKADEFLSKFQRDSKTLSIHLEPIQGTLDKQLRSARIGDDYRVILRAPESGDVFLVLFADHHDEAYRWAETKQTAIHPATGSLQIFDTTLAQTVHVETERVERVASAESPQTGLFAAFDDASLFVSGVPTALLPSVRAIRDEAELDAMLPHLPPEAGEVLTGLAAGLSLDEALEEVLGRTPPVAGAPKPAPIDTGDVIAALERESTQRQFRLLDADLDLEAALNHPLDVWRVFLHPRQRRLAEARTKGPVRILGGAGTGKTVVALHRARFLLREVFTKPDDRVLFTTFNVNLAHDIRSQLGKLLTPEEMARVEVKNIDAWARELLKSQGIVIRTSADAENEAFQQAFDVYGDDEHTLDFYRSEWSEVIQEQGLRTEDEYVFAMRTHRGVPLARTERRKLWPVFEQYRANLERDGYCEYVDVLRRARAQLESASEKQRYRSVIVDEVQDFSPDALKLVRAIAGPERPDDLFLVGDAHQRIYRRPTALSTCGIQVRGRRSHTLRLNYRTTGSICRWSLGVLRDVEVDDLDNGKADRRGYVSLREGPAPSVHVLPTSIEEERAVVELVQTGIELGWAPEGICIVARRSETLTDRFAPALKKVGIATHQLDKEEPPRGDVRLATMHRVKGLEFPIVVLVGMSKSEVPHSSAELRSDDPLVREQALQREKSLLYVAASRARDELYVFAAGTLSPLISAWAGERTSGPATPKKRNQKVARSESAEVTRNPEVADPIRNPEVADAAPVDVLATNLASLELPARMANFVARKGLQTLSELVQLSPSALMSEPNLGRTSIAKTRVIIEGLAGRPWESLLDSAYAIDAGGAAISLDALNERAGWDAVRLALTAVQREVALASIELPTRMETFATKRSLITLGELAELSASQLKSEDNLGRTSIAGLAVAVRAHFQRVDVEPDAESEGLLESWKSMLERLEGVPRIILTRRSGLGGTSETLREIGEMLGVTRERIRQIESESTSKLVRKGWAQVVRRRADAALAGGAVTLLELSADAWWSAAVAFPEVVHYLIADVVEAEAQVIAFDDMDWLSRAPLPAVKDAWLAFRHAASEVPLPAPREAFEALTTEAQVGKRLARHFVKMLGERFHYASEAPDAHVLAIGDGRVARLMALLRSSPEPIRVEDAEAVAGGRSHLPEEVIRFGGGRIGLRSHIPYFDMWKTRLVPACVSIIERVDPERQWSCAELHDELREEFELPPWLNPFVLAAFIRAGDELKSLGRLRVALPGKGENESRIYLHDLMEKLLREAGRPMEREVLVEQINARMGISEFAMIQCFARPQFVRLDGLHYGLTDRDVPGGAAAIAEVRDEVASVLERRGRGLSLFHAHEHVITLSSTHASWTRELVYSVLHGDPRFRFTQSGAVGLATWDSVGVPTRLELVRSALEKSEGRVSVDAVVALIQAHYGETVGRGTVGAIAMKVGANLSGDWVVAKG
jgi:superfamily I DNA/RNA helicase